MRKLTLPLIALVFCALLNACIPEEFVEQSQQRFADQGFKTAIALIELHKIRNDQYPENLEQIQFQGDWDPIYHMYVSYQKTANGYVLNINDGQGKDLAYPAEFWRGLGLEQTNVKGFSK